MTLLIIEDEQLAAEELAIAIAKVAPEWRISKTLVSVKESIAYLKEQPAPDLIFSDIQLGDGLSFEIFASQPLLNTPVIFCTAYDEYMLEAFHTNGIEYLLKPVREDRIRQALSKYQALQRNFAPHQPPMPDIYKDLWAQLMPKPRSLLVNQREKIIPLPFDEVALFYIEYQNSFLVTFKEVSYSIDKPLDELEELAGDGFFRVNRQCLVNRQAVRHAAYSLTRQLLVYLTVHSYTAKMTVSKEKSRLFLSWLSGS